MIRAILLGNFSVILTLKELDLGEDVIGPNVISSFLFPYLFLTYIQVFQPIKAHKMI